MKAPTKYLVIYDIDKDFAEANFKDFDIDLLRDLAIGFDDLKRAEACITRLKSKDGVYTNVHGPYKLDETPEQNI